MEYELNELIGWARRSGGDRLTRQRDSLTTDGTADLVLSNDGYIVVNVVKLAGEDLTTADYTLDGNVITFDPVPPDQTSVIVGYQNATYSDTEVLGFLLDAARDVKADLSLKAQIAPSGYRVIDPDAKLITAPNEMNQDVERLIAMRAGINIRTDVANGAGGDAIMIKDGDTTIDTAATAKANESVLKRMNAEYDEKVRKALANRLTGTASTDVYPSSSSHRRGFGYGYTEPRP
jgi:hypothetical protein